MIGADVGNKSAVKRAWIFSTRQFRIRELFDTETEKLMILVDDLMVLRPLVRRANDMRGNSVRNVGSDERKPFPICMAVKKRRLVGQNRWIST